MKRKITIINIHTMDKQFINGAFIKVLETQYGELINIDFGPKFLESYEKYKNEKGYLRTTLKKSQGGKHYMELNTWAPTEAQEPAKAGKTVTEEEAKIEGSEDLLF